LNLNSTGCLRASLMKGAGERSTPAGTCCALHKKSQPDRVNTQAFSAMVKEMTRPGPDTAGPSLCAVDQLKNFKLHQKVRGSALPPTLPAVDTAARAGILLLSEWQSWRQGCRPRDGNMRTAGA